jgi:hypothetical protein
MKNVLSFVFFVCFTVLLIGPALAQQPVAPSPTPQPTASGPSLAVTMQFIQDKLNDNNKASWIDSTQGVLGAVPDTVTHEISNVVADQSQCRISYHLFTKHSASYRWVPTSDGKNNKGEDSSFSLRAVQEIVVKPWEQFETEWLAKNGHPDTTVTSVNPPMTALVVRQPHGVENVFTFTDAALADRLAKAMVHAVELCGGGKTEEPF